MSKKLYEKYIGPIFEQQGNRLIKSKIIEFFKSNSKPGDDEIHEFASKLGIDKHKFEEIIYELLGSIFGYGKSIEFDGEYDSHELSMGMKVEMEHTNCELIATKISEDHLAEIPDYYTRLKKMEEEAGVEEET